MRYIVGIIKNLERDKVLLGKKKEGEHPHNLGGKWHNLGGKIEGNEDPESALKREIKEESGLEIKIEKFLAKNIINQDEVNWYECSSNSNEFKLPEDGELTELRWVYKNWAHYFFDSENIKLLPEEILRYFNIEK
ncbi:NUDIX domain-containing protein [Candidatus Pacearchaeota archaeon]|nr:NUDIX domain-containing protein [Candidatus Pacearchaeota archaeon]